MWITRRGYETLFKKMALLEKKRKEFLKQLGEEASKDFDLPENAFWKQLQVELKINLPRQMAELQKVISESKIIEEVTHLFSEEKKACLGSRVKIRLDKEERTVVIVGPHDLDVVENGVSYLSPLGKAILRAEEGEERTFKTPLGEREITVLSIEKGI